MISEKRGKISDFPFFPFFIFRWGIKKCIFSRSRCIVYSMIFVIGILFLWNIYAEYRQYQTLRVLELLGEGTQLEEFRGIVQNADGGIKKIGRGIYAAKFNDISLDIKESNGIINEVTIWMRDEQIVMPPWKKEFRAEFNFWGRMYIMALEICIIIPVIFLISILCNMRKSEHP